MYMDLELLDWLNTVTFPEEARYADLNYAEKAYSIFTDDIKHSATTRASIFGTLHVDATELLMDLMEKTGLKTFIGKVNMDRNGSLALQEQVLLFLQKILSAGLKKLQENTRMSNRFSLLALPLPAVMNL